MRRFLSVSIYALVMTCAVATPDSGVAAQRESRTGAFVVDHSLTLPGKPEVLYDAITGDISGWWDHKFSEKPARFFIEAKPGGGFYEYFDAAGNNGVRHATVIYADRGKLLRFDGPLGLTGNAVQCVTSYTFKAAGSDSTRLDVSVHCAGEVQEAWPGLVDGVWKHFIVDRFQSYILAGKHLKK